MQRINQSVPSVYRSNFLRIADPQAHLDSSFVTISPTGPFSGKEKWHIM